MEGENKSLDAPTSANSVGNVQSQNEDDLKRFQVELEFLQCLANPFYLSHLAQHGYLDQREFVSYLKYLLYWKLPEYAIFIKYPACLHMLDLLQEEAFRRELISPVCAKFVEEQLLLHWQYYAFRRRMAQPTPTAALEGGDPTQQSLPLITNGNGHAPAVAADTMLNGS